MAYFGRLLLLGLLLAASCALRLFGFDWGSGQHFHPDEKASPTLRLTE